MQGFKYLYVTPSDFKKVRMSPLGLYRISNLAGVRFLSFPGEINSSGLMPENYFLCYFLQLSASNSMHAELIEDDGESRYQITDIIGEWVSGFL